jgi:hypothetical protein
MKGWLQLYFIFAVLLEVVNVIVWDVDVVIFDVSCKLISNMSNNVVLSLFCTAFADCPFDSMT